MVWSVFSRFHGEPRSAGLKTGRSSPTGSSLALVEAGDVLELDELWSFVGSKSEQRCLCLALCRRTGQMVAFYLGDRSENSALGLWLGFA